MPFGEGFKLVHTTIFVIAHERDIKDLKKNKEENRWIETIQIEHPMMDSHNKIEIANLPKLSKITIDNDVQIGSLNIEDCENLQHIDLSKDVEIHTLILKHCPSLKEIRLEDLSSINTLIIDESVDSNVLLSVASQAIIRTLKWDEKTYKNVDSSERLKYLKPVHGYSLLNQ